MLLSVRGAKDWLLLTSVFIAATAVIIAGVQAQIYGPKFLVQEEVSCAYYHNGSVKTTAARTGQFFVSVPNDNDVLQYIRVNLNPGFGDNTTIQNQTVYQDVLTSQPDPNDWELLYVNVTGDYSATSYSIDANVDDIAPTINLSMEYSNDRGGYDLYDDANIDDANNNITITFSMTNPSTYKSLSGVTSYIYFRTDTGDSGQEANVTYTSAQDGTAASASSDGDGYNDYITWTGVSLAAGSTVNLTAVLNITSGVHIGAADDSVNLQPSSGDSMNSTWSATGELFSKISVHDKLARGPIRQGVDLYFDGNYWLVRGFVRNMAEASPNGEYLTYNVSEWSVYEVDPSTGAPYSTASQSGEFNETATSSHFTPADGRIYTDNNARSSNTSKYNTSSVTKPYIAVYFNWGVIWNSTNSENNVTYINSTMDLTELYLLDLTLEKSISGTISPEVGGENITINDTIKNVGSNETGPVFVQILSYVPSNTTVGNWRGSGWDIEDAADIEVYLNDTYEISPDGTNCALTVTDSTENSNGFVNLSIYDLAACDLAAGGTVGHKFNSNDGSDSDNLTISFRATSDIAMTTGDSYTFWSIGQLNSSSGTMDREYNLANQTVTVTGKRIIGYKDLIAYNVNIPTLINASINISVEDVGSSGISGIKFMDYVPANTISYEDYVGNFSSGNWVVIRNGTVMTYGVDYSITDNSTATLSDGLSVHMFEFVNATGNSTWNLTGGEYIEVSYQINFTSAGTYVLPVIIAAFDPDTGIGLDTAFYGVVKVVVPEPSLSLTINEGELAQSKTVLVGKPAVWSRRFEVYNPNPKPVTASFETAVFEDATDGYVSYFDENGRRVEELVTFSKDSSGRKVMQWQSSVSAFETREYDISVLTPPVLEIDRDVEVLEQLPEKKVKLRMDIYLKSFAQEDYGNVVLNLPVSYQKIEEARDGFGNRLPFTGGADTSSITVDRMGAGELKTVTVIYQESYPTIIITPDRDRYNLNSPVSLDILVINGGEAIEYPYIEVEIYTPGMDVVFSNIEKLGEMEPLEKTELYEKFVIPAAAPSGMYVASARFREDFAVLADGTGNFYVMGVSGGIPEALEILMVVLVSVVLIYFSLRRLKEVRGERSSTYGGI